MRCDRRRSRTTHGVGRLLRRLERERQDWLRHLDDELPEWQQGFCEGLRAAQRLIRKGV